MAQGTFPIVGARQELGFTPTTAVRANIDVRTGEGAVGAAIGQGVLAVAGELQERSVREELLRQKNRDNLDSLSKRQADQRRKLTTAQLRTMKDSTPPEKWEEASIPIINAGNEEIAGFDFSPQALAEQQVIITGDAKVIPKQIFADATRVISAAAVKSAEEMLTDAYRLNLSDLPQKNIDFIKTLKSNGIPAKAITSAQTAAKEAGGKLRNEDAVKVKKNQASIFPEAVSIEMEAEQQLRKKGEGSPELEGLTDKDLEDINDFTKTVGEKQKSDSEIKLASNKIDAFSQIRDGATNIDAMIDANNADTIQSDEDKLKFAEQIPTYFNKWNSTIAADSSDEDAYDTLTQLSEKVERGAASPAEFEDKYAELKHLLDKDDQRAVREKDIVATKSMQNRTFSDALFIARPTLVELTASDLDSIKLARQNAEVIKDIPTINMFNIALKKNQAEQWNMGRFRKGLRTQIAQNPEWGQEQIFVAQEILTDQLDLPVGELLKQFDEQNPNSAILKEPPDNDFKDIWSGLDIDQKSKVWELRMRGAPTSVILREFE